MRTLAVRRWRLHTFSYPTLYGESHAQQATGHQTQAYAHRRSRSMNADTRYPVEYQETGTGEAIVLVPGSFSTGSSWRAIASPLWQRYRTISTSLSGYGKTQERRVPGSDAMADQLDILETVLQKANAPVHLVAHSFGACAALLLAIRRPVKVLSLTLLEPTVFEILSLCQEHALHKQVLDLVDRYTSDWKAADALAVRHIIDFYGGEGCFGRYPPSVQEKLAGQTATNILDWQSGYASGMRLDEFAALRVPTAIVCGTASHMAMRRSNQLLCQYLPHADLTMLEGANHFMMATHADQLTEIITQHISASQ